MGRVGGEPQGRWNQGPIVHVVHRDPIIPPTLFTVPVSMNGKGGGVAILLFNW